MKGLRSSAATSVTFVANPFARMDYLDPGAPARAQAARKLDLARLPEPSNDIARLPKSTPAPAATTVFDPLPSCQAPGFLCKDGLTCVAPAQLCDGMADCPRHEEGEGGEDEDGCSGSGGGQPDEVKVSPILVALTSRPEVSTVRQVEEEEGSIILEEETQNVLSEVLRVVDETRRRLEETKESKAGVTSTDEAVIGVDSTTEAATTNNQSGVTKEVDNTLASTTEDEEEEEGTLVTVAGSSISARSTKPTEVWTLRPNWSTGGSTIQEEETTTKVLAAVEETTDVTSPPTEQVTASGERVTTVAVETAEEEITTDPVKAETVKAEDIASPVTDTVPLIEATSLFIESELVTEESNTESDSKDLITTTASVKADDDNSVTTENAVTTEQNDVKDFPEVNLEKKDNMLLNDTGDHQGEEEVPPGAGL